MATPLRATYRLQLTPTFGFAEARKVVPYLQALGISHLYLSPSLQARHGSEHGYDVVDPTRLSDDLGGPAAFEALAQAGMGVILDIVPNHMAIDDDNALWHDPAQREQVFDVDRSTGWHRRFFDVDDLVGVRQEDPAVFELTHRTVIDLVERGLIDGVRVDHPDGLSDPAGYLHRLRDAGIEKVWIEKILHPGEALRDWPVTGTVGYEYLADVSALFVHPAGEGPITEAYARTTGEVRPFAEIAREGRVEQATGTFAPEVERLRALADLPGLVDALVDLPVYRTYVEPAHDLVAEEDRALVAAAGITGALARTLLLEDRGHDEFVTRFQQTSSPIMAKGVEDTAFYRYSRLLALNEVGNDPGRFSLGVDAFHAANADRLARFPEALLAATTHDTKRSADTRFRIGALAGMADEFVLHLDRWMAATEGLVRDGAPSPGERWFLFQTLLGTWPITTDRLDGYLVKALREAKVHTSWVEPDEAHEQQVQQFVRDVLASPDLLADFRPFAEAVALAGEQASVAETVLRCTVPGVPDVFQGDELWFLALVDPDNRRPMDWISRRRALARVQRGAAPTRASRKLHVLHRSLDLRRRLPGPFVGAYEPLEAGPDTLAFVRGAAELVVVAALRPDPTATVDLPGGAWVDVLVADGQEGPTGTTSGGRRRVAELVGHQGVALLARPTAAGR